MGECNNSLYPCHMAQVSTCFLQSGLGWAEILFLCRGDTDHNSCMTVTLNPYFKTHVLSPRCGGVCRYNHQEQTDSSEHWRKSGGDTPAWQEQLREQLKPVRKAGTYYWEQKFVCN